MGPRLDRKHAILGRIAVGLVIGGCAALSVGAIQVTRLSLPVDARQQEQQALVVPVDHLSGTRPVLRLSVTNHATHVLHLTGFPEIDRLTIPPQSTQRMVVLLPVIRDESSVTLAVSGSHDQWSFDSATVSQAYGFSRGLLNLAVVPRDAPRAGPAWSVVLVAVLALAVLCLPLPPMGGGWGSRGLRVGAAVALAILTMVAVSPLLTPYRIVLDPRTFALCAGLVLSHRLVVAVRMTLHSPAMRRPLARAALCSALAVVFSTAVVLRALESFDGNVSGFLHVSERWAHTSPFLQERPDIAADLPLRREGYDGQFMYFMAFDPLLLRFADDPVRYREVTDFPPYRFGRILFSAVTRVLSPWAGPPQPAVMIGLLVLSHGLLAFGLGRLAQRMGMPVWWSLVHLLVPGFLVSLFFCLPESMAWAALTGGACFAVTGRYVWMVVAFGAALLTRETGLVFVLAVLAGLSRDVGLRRIVMLAAASLVPVVVWRGYVAARLFPDFGWTALFPDPGDFTLPFAGLVELTQAIATGVHPSSEATSGLVYALLLVAALATTIWAFVQDRHPLWGAAVAYGLIAVSLNYGKIWSHVPSGERGTIDLFMALLVAAICRGRTHPRTLSVVSGLFALLAIYVFVLDAEAWLSRAGLLVLR